MGPSSPTGGGPSTGLEGDPDETLFGWRMLVRIGDYVDAEGVS
jgi:hypothetical protein